MRLLLHSFALIATLGCGSDPSFVGDASVLTDAKTPTDTSFSVLPPVTTGRVRVVEGPLPLRVVAGVSVRAVNAAMRVIEATTDARGEAALDLPPAEAPWTLTAAQRGRGALSIVGLRALPEGDLRLDAPSGETQVAPVPLSGTVRGLEPGAVALIDAYDFDTVTTARGATTFSSGYYPVFSDVPLEMSALELINGHAVRALSLGTRPRSGDPIGDITADFTSPAVVPVRSVTIRVNPPSPESVSASNFHIAGDSRVGLIEPRHGFTFLTVGTGAMTFSAVAGLRWNIDLADGPLHPNFVSQAIDAGPWRINLLAHDLVPTEVISIPSVNRLAFAGTSLNELTLSTDATGFDAMAFHVGESETRLPRWRCFVLPEMTSAPVALPDLPAGITPADLGLSGQVSLVGLLIYMHHDRPWSTAVVNGAVPEYRATVGTLYSKVGDTWR